MMPLACLAMVSLLVATAGSVLAQGPGQPALTLTASPATPVVGTPVRIDLSIGSRDGPLGLTLLARYPISAVDVSTGARIETVATLPLAGERVFSATLVFPAPGRWQVHSPAWDSAAGNTLQLDVLPGSPEACQFTLGFAALHDQIPDAVGTCTSDEQHDAAHGDALQTTTAGLLVWRKLDNWTAFTDGTSTWIDGPFGLQQRPNAQRLWWEPNPDRLPILPPPRPGERCHTAGLALAPTDQGDAAVGHEGLYLAFTNVLDVPCTLRGYVGAQLLDQQGNPLPTSVARAGGHLFYDPGPAPVLVPPGRTVRFGIEWVHIPVGTETSCPTARQLAVIPPDEYAPLVVPATITACGGGQLHVTAVQPLAADGPDGDGSR